MKVGFLNTIFINSVTYSFFKISKHTEDLHPIGELDWRILLLFQPQSVRYLLRAPNILDEGQRFFENTLAPKIIRE